MTPPLPTPTRTPKSFNGPQKFSVIAMGAVAGCLPALQPILLGSMMMEGRLTAAQIGQAATLEGLGMAISMTFAAIGLRPTHLRWIATGAILGALGANLMTTRLSGYPIILARGLNGLCSGILLWLLVGLIARAAIPARLFAIYITTQASGTFLLSWMFTKLIVPRIGIAGGYATIAGIDLTLLLAVLFMPRTYSTLPSSSTFALPSTCGSISLLGVASYLGGVMAFWVYLAPLARQLGFTKALLGSAVTAGIGIQIAGGISASMLAQRVAAFTVCITGALACIGAIALILTVTVPSAWFAGIIVFAFFWMFVPPFQMPLLIEVDPSMRAAMLVGSAQLLGCAMGPLVASRLVSDTSVTGAATVAMAFFAASIGLTAFGHGRA